MQPVLHRVSNILANGNNPSVLKQDTGICMEWLRESLRKLQLIPNIQNSGSTSTCSVHSNVLKSIWMHHHFLTQQSHPFPPSFRFTNFTPPGLATWPSCSPSMETKGGLHVVTPVPFSKRWFNAALETTCAQEGLWSIATGPHSSLIIVKQWLGARGYRFRAEKCPPTCHHGKAYKT